MRRTGKKIIIEPGRKKTSRARIIGTSTPRLEGPEKVSGKAIYASDVWLPGMLWCKVLRSPIPYGRIKGIDVSRALALSGVAAVVTGQDVAGLLIGRKIYDMPILADGVVRFMARSCRGRGGNGRYCRRGCRLIEVDYEELPPILDPLEALEPSAPLLHPNVQRYRGLLHPIQQPSNVFIDMKWSKGDIDAGFRIADLIVENTFTTRPVHQAYIEPHACIVQARAGGGADIWGCSKVPFALREQIAVAFGQSVDNFVVHPCYIGGCFGGKGDFMDVPACYLLSLKTGRPVKMVMDYGEEFIAGNPRHAAIVRVKSGVKNGRLVAHRRITSSIAAPMQRSSRKGTWSVQRRPRGRTTFPMSTLRKKSSIRTRFRAGTCARLAIRRDFSPTSRRWI